MWVIRDYWGAYYKNGGIFQPAEWTDDPNEAYVFGSIFEAELQQNCVGGEICEKPDPFKQWIETYEKGARE